LSVSLTLALDAMGGDDAPDMVIGGIDIAHRRFPDVRFLLFGDESRLRPLLAARPQLAAACSVHHTPDVVTAEDRPSQALRKARNSSMRLAIDAVRDGAAGGVVSAGNTGALMAMAKVVLKTLPGIQRPALATCLPTLEGETVMLDLGANVESDEYHLVQFALMGADYAHTVRGVANPKVGLLNVGVEELKGNEIVKAAGQILRAANPPFIFHGFIEGDDINKGTVDVVVTDGFTGNVALKTVEGAARMFTEFMSAAYRDSFRARLGFAVAKPALTALRAHFDPRAYNGAVFLGLNGIVVKSHGGTDEIGFANAVVSAINMIAERLTDRIVADFEHFLAEVVPDSKAAAS